MYCYQMLNGGKPWTHWECNNKKMIAETRHSLDHHSDSTHSKKHICRN